MTRRVAPTLDYVVRNFDYLTDETYEAARAELRALLAVAALVRKVTSRPLEPGEVADPEFKQAQRLIARLDRGAG